MVERLAESLQLALRERSALLLSPGYAPAYAETGFDADALRAVREALDDVCKAMGPIPMIVTAGRIGGRRFVNCSVGFASLSTWCPARDSNPRPAA
jgi:hypothetical protein